MLMDAYDCVARKLDLREFSSKNVPADIKRKILDAGRLTGSGMNVQHWRFILIQEPDALKKLAEDSTTGSWVRDADFAVIVMTNPKYGFHMLDAGRVTQNMQVAAWSFRVASCIYTGFKTDALRRDFNLPADLSPSVVIGFGYSAKNVSGKKKNRKSLNEVAYTGKYGTPFDA